MNADSIAIDLRESGETNPDFQAGRLMLGRVDELVTRGKSLAFETTLASRALLRRISLMQEKKYLFHLIYLWLPSAEMAIARVAARVRAGGHAIPENVIRRRYDRSLANFFNLYRPIADSWLMLDNSDAPEPRPFAWRNVGGPLHIVRQGPWDKLRKKHEIDPLARR